MNTKQEATEIRSIAYNDAGILFKDELITLHSRSGVGRISKIRYDGTPSKDLCPCCMLPDTHKRIMEMILASRITKVIWESGYGHCASEYFPGLYDGKKLSETEYEFLVRRDEDK